MSSTKKRIDFEGQNIYLGIDVHKKSFTVTVQGDLLVYKTFSQPADADQLLKYLYRHYPGASYHAVYEAGFSGFWLSEALKAGGVNCILVNACDVPTTDKEKRQKRDRLDSRKLARSLKNGELEALHIPDKNNQLDRSLIRTRKRLVSNKTRCRNRIKSLLDFYGVKVPQQFSHGGTHWSRRFMGWLEKVDLGGEGGNQALGLLIKEAEYLRDLLLEAERSIRKLSRNSLYKERVDLLLSVPGIGTLTAMLILTEIEDITRFSSLDKLCAYVGLIPNVYASGDTEKVGDMTKRGNKHLRAYLVESSWVAVRNDPALAHKYNELCSKMTGNKAIIRIARKLLNRIRYVLTNKEAYVLSVAA